MYSERDRSKKSEPRKGEPSDLFHRDGAQLSTGIALALAKLATGLPSVGPSATSRTLEARGR